MTRAGGVELDRAVESIRVGCRFRHDLGDLDELCASIEALGLLQPITITPDGTLVCGARRLVAVKQLGWKCVKVWVSSTVSSRLHEVLAEQHENTLRKPFTPSEAAALYAELKRLYAADAARRQHATRFGARESHAATVADGGADSAPPQIPASADGTQPPAAGKARRRAAWAITGKDSSWSLEHVAEVQRLADDPNTPEPLRQIAQRELAGMDADGTINGHYLAVQTATASADLARLAADPDRPPAVRARAEAELQAVHASNGTPPSAELVKAARAAVARATGATDPSANEPPRLPATRYRPRAFWATAKEIQGWWEHYDPAEIAAGLTEQQWQRVRATLAGSITFIEAVAAARDAADRDDNAGGTPDQAACF